MPFSFGDFNPSESNILANIRAVEDAILPKLLQSNQKARFYNYKRASRFYLLDVERFPENYTLSISGSSGDIYKVKIDQEERKISCSCPDGRGYCQGHNTICKHSYFTIIKVLMMKELAAETSNFFTTNELTEEEVELMFTRLYSVWENREGSAQYMNTNFINQYQTHKEKQKEQAAGSTTDEEESTGDKFQVVEFTNPDDVCAVCYCEMEKPEDAVKCPGCRKEFHKSCMQHWFNTGKNTCVMCRNPVWEEYIRDQKHLHQDIWSETYENVYNIVRLQ